MLLKAGTEKEKVSFLSHCPRRRQGERERERDNGWMDGWRPSFHGRIGRRRTKGKKTEGEIHGHVVNHLPLVSSVVSRLSSLAFGL